MILHWVAAEPVTDPAQRDEACKLWFQAALMLPCCGVADGDMLCVRWVVEGSEAGQPKNLNRELYGEAAELVGFVTHENATGFCTHENATVTVLTRSRFN